MLLILIAFVSLANASVWKADLNNPRSKDVMQDGVHIGTGRIKRYIELDDKGSNNIKPLVCDLPDGKPGLCKAMQQCTHEGTTSDFRKLVDTLCILDNSKIGTCCPDNNKLFGPEGLAGDLPATANKDEQNEMLLKIERTENRGCGFSTRPRDQVPSSEAVNARVWPWMASVTIIGVKHFCGGALITERHILTAAHCFTKYPAEDLEARLGEFDFKQANESRTYVFRVIEKIEHEEYDKMTHKNDISILKLHRSAVFNTYVWPICLPPMGLELVNQTSVLTGWGTVKYGGPMSSVLKEVEMPIWDLQRCNQSLTDTVFDENYCVGSYTGGKDACQYDSGSPLMYEMPSGRWAVIGVVSWGLRCGEPNHPGLYTRVDKYLRWIALNT